MEKSSKLPVKLPILIAGAGVIIFLIAGALFNFRDELFSLLFPKPPSLAACSSTSSEFIASLTGAAEVPPNTSASSSASVNMGLDPVDNTKLSFTISSSDIDPSQVTAIHIHSPASASQEAPPTVTLFDSSTQTFTLSYSGEATLPPEVLSDLRGGNAYVNLHTITYPNGEIRGQIGCPSVNISTPVAVKINVTQGIIEELTFDLLGVRRDDTNLVHFFISQTKDFQRVYSGTWEGNDVIASPSAKANLSLNQRVLVISDKLASGSAVATESARAVYILR